MERTTRSFYDILRTHAQERPGHPAIITDDRTLDYRLLLEDIDTAAAALVGAGLRPGEKAALWGYPDGRWIPALLGIVRAGGTAVVLNANLTPDDAAPLVDFADCGYILFGPSHDLRGEAAERPQLAEVFGLPEERIFSLMDTDLSALPAGDTAGRGQDVYADAFMIYTSGTTAFPKGVMLSQYSYLNEMAAVNDAVSSVRGTRAIAAAPLFHVYGLMAGLMYLLSGDTICLPRRIKADVIAEMIECRGVTDIYSIPIIYQHIADCAQLTEQTAPTARLCFTAGSYIPPAQMALFERTLPKAAFINLYGMTETSSGYCLTRPGDTDEHRYTTVGRVIDGVEAAVWNEERGILPAGEVGEIVARGYILKNSYYRLPPEQQNVDADGWFHSGDLGVFDAAGYLRIVGRIKDLVIKGGENIAPAEIEAAILDEDDVRECRVFGFPDPMYGEDLGACLTLVGGGSFSETELRRTLRQKVGSYKVPRYFFVFERFPLSPNGKTDQRALREDMLGKLHRIRLQEELARGVEALSLSIKLRAFRGMVTAAVAQACTELAGFGEEKIAAVCEDIHAVLGRVKNGPVQLRLRVLCMERSLRLEFTCPCADCLDEGHEPIRPPAADSCGMEYTADGLAVRTLDYRYPRGFDICAELLPRA